MDRLPLLLMVLAAGCGPMGIETRTGGVDEPPIPESLPPRALIDGGRAPGPMPAPTPEFPMGETPLCFATRVLPAGCDPAGQWRLTHSQPEGVCPYGASRHDIVLFSGMGLLCMQWAPDFQKIEAGPPGACAIVLSGTHPVPAASVPYMEAWTSRLTFSAGGGSGETEVVVTGGSNCMRKFQTTIDRK
jgi:hypothetical protein